MTKPNFNESQMRAACAIVHAYGVNHGSTGTDLHHRSAVLGVLAVMIGRLGAVPEIYRHLTKDVELSNNDKMLDEAMAQVEAGDGVETVIVSKEDYDRWNTILSGLSIDVSNMTITVSPEAAVLMRDPSDATPFPAEGIYVPYTTATFMVEKVMADAANPDTIIGKQVRESIAASEQSAPADEPNGDGKADKINFDDMTVEALRTFAEENGVDLGGASKKADIIRTLREFNF